MEDENTVAELLTGVAQDLHAIRRNVARLARESYRQDLLRIASTSQRQEIWRLADGSLNTEAIATKAAIPLRTVQYFIQEAEKAGLIETAKRGFPKRTSDYDEIPSEWKPYRMPASGRSSSNALPSLETTSQ